MKLGAALKSIKSAKYLSNRTWRFVVPKYLQSGYISSTVYAFSQKLYHEVNFESSGGDPWIRNHKRAGPGKLIEFEMIVKACLEPETSFR